MLYTVNIILKTSFWRVLLYNNEIDFAAHQVLYYTERRDEEMSEYRKYGGKKYV